MHLDPSTQDIVKTTLLQLIDAVKQGGAWVAGQIPDVLHQLIVWTMVKGVVFMLFLLIIWPVYLRSMKKVRQVVDDESFMLTVVLTVTLLIMLTVFIVLNPVSDALKALFAPKLFLLEYAADLVK